MHDLTKLLREVQDCKDSARYFKLKEYFYILEISRFDLLRILIRVSY